MACCTEGEDGGGTFWGAEKLRLHLKTKNREDLKEVVKKMGGGKKQFRGDKNSLWGVKKFLGGCAKKRSSKKLGG